METRKGMKTRASFLLFVFLLFIFMLVTTKLHFERIKMDSKWYTFDSPRVGKEEDIDVDIHTDISILEEEKSSSSKLGFLPRGIVASTSDFELKQLWERDPNFQRSSVRYTALLAVPVGLKQKKNVDLLVKKVLVETELENGRVNEWNDLDWSSKAVHILAHNQTKWWFAKRFLHPDVVSSYDYVFLWDEDLGVENFHPGRYLQIMMSEGLEITQPALDPDLSEVHHRITVRRKARRFHRRVYFSGGSKNCSAKSTEPPCTGWVEGMAPVFSRAAWSCVWHLIQNDLVHGWGLDMKLGYCAQGDRTKKVGVIDSEYIVHQGIQTLGASPPIKTPSRFLDLRTHIRRQSAAELQEFRKRWDRAVSEDKEWTDPFGT
ncbi:hypothetical protein MKW94_025950 [Papaver nudicaule]|uniref:Lysine ketoglutarate reductase trans-splicing-like protein n=1 Tax=Papaver nudicaule TaxID=74823 RepID=A0AA41V1D8_PAPNU|nr:hypothetical protein [Papaver nudicaule]